MFATILCILPIIAYSLPVNSPVIVSIETDNRKSLHLGPYDRTRFDLVETFHPLGTAGIARAEQVEQFRQRVEGVKVADANGAPVAHDGETRTPAARRVVFGEWSEWSAWTPCSNGERSRLRHCFSKRAGHRVVCHGDPKQSQMCFSSHEHIVPVASDPWSIEKEIMSGGDFVAKA